MWPDTLLGSFYFILTPTMLGRDLFFLPSTGQEGSETLSNFPRSHSKEMAERGLEPFLFGAELMLV